MWLCIRCHLCSGHPHPLLLVFVIHPVINLFTISVVDWIPHLDDKCVPDKTRWTEDIYIIIHIICISKHPVTKLKLWPYHLPGQVHPHPSMSTTAVNQTQPVQSKEERMVDWANLVPSTPLMSNQSSVSIVVFVDWTNSDLHNWKLIY